MLSSLAAAAEPPRLEFTRMVAHWANYANDDYLPFVMEAEPELVQLGFYGAHYWSLAHTPQFGGYPAHFPLQGLEETGQWFEEKNTALHQRKIRVVGHFNVEFLVGDPEGPDGPRGFFKFYRDLWDEKKLGPKPVADPLAFLERGADGEPIVNNSYSIGGMKEYWACLRNPHWQKILKAWVKQGVDRGLDGFIANYFYRHKCHCEHCQKGFRDYLAERYPPAELKEKLRVDNLADHDFGDIVYWHKPEESTPLKREMLRWSQISNKQVFDEVFLKYGRSLKPDLIVAQWDHLGNFNQISGDERCMLPADLWGKQESYLWYSTGSAAFYTDLKNGFYGDGTLQARYIRGAFDDKPFTLGKYEGTRIRAAIAELAANGGAPMGFYTRFTDPAARATIVQYYQFLKRYNDLYHANRSHAEVLLLFPRQGVHQGDVAAVAKFREIGGRMLDNHVLFDILPDDLLTEETSARYAAVVSTEQPTIPPDVQKQLSRFKAPPAVRVSASTPAQGHEITLHLVNYNREEPPPRNGKPSAGRGIVDEKPIGLKQVAVDLALPSGLKVLGVECISPEEPQAKQVEHRFQKGRLTFHTPPMLVYSVIRIRYEGDKITAEPQ